MKMTHVASACGLFGAMALAVLTGCESTEHSSGRSEGRRMDDKELSARVKDDLENEPVYKFDGVYVRTYGGIVQLSGFVNSEDQKRRAGMVAERVPGVSQVENAITLKPTAITATGRTNEDSRVYSH